MQIRNLFCQAEMLVIYSMSKHSIKLQGKGLKPGLDEKNLSLYVMQVMNIFLFYMLIVP